MEPTTDPGHERLRTGTVYIAREACPMLLCLLVPVAIVLGIATYAGPSVSPAASPPPGPYDSFHFEQVGVGVKRLVDDGAGHRPGDYQLIGGHSADLVAIEASGSVITCCDQPGLLASLDAGTEMHRLGQREPVATWDPDTIDVDDIGDVAASPDGSVWIAEAGVARLDDGDWSWRWWRSDSDIVAVGSDGAIWANAPGKSARIIRLGEGKPSVFVPGDGLPRAVGRWGSTVTAIATTPDGQVWAGIGADGPRRPGGLLRYDGERWRIARPLGRDVDTSVVGVTVAPDGTVWTYLTRDVGKDARGRQPDAYIARLDDRGWTVFDQTQGVPRYGRNAKQREPFSVLMRAGGDGTLWLAPPTRGSCGRLLTFREDDTTDYLDDGACVKDIELDPDGRAWVSVLWSPGAGAERVSAALYLVEPPS